MSASPLTPAHTAALHTVLHILHTTGVWYRATGGLAGNVHGSAWPLHDIDLDISRDEWPTLAPALAPWLVQPLAPYADDEFRIAMAVAHIDGIAIEFCQIEDAWLASPTGWRPQPADRTQREGRTWHGFALWVHPLDALLAYKTQLGRHPDVADLQRLRPAGA